MAYYHCSPVGGLTILEPRQPESFQKPRGVYMTTLLPMALMYGVQNYEYTYGYTRDGQIYFSEYFPNALEVLYKGKQASLYLCDPVSVSTTKIPNEAVSDTAVPIVSEKRLPDVLEALLEQERLGALVLHRYGELSSKHLDWVRNVEADTIRQRGLLDAGNAEAEYYRRNYPESWALVEGEKRSGDGGS